MLLFKGLKVKISPSTKALTEPPSGTSTFTDGAIVGLSPVVPAKAVTGTNAVLNNLPVLSKDVIKTSIVLSVSVVFTSSAAKLTLPAAGVNVALGISDALDAVLNDDIRRARE